MYYGCRMIVGVIKTWLSLMSVLILSSTESEIEGLPLTRLPAATASTSAPTVLPPVTADRRAATLQANKCVICVLYISFHPMAFQNFFFFNYFFTKLICLWQSA